MNIIKVREEFIDDITTKYKNQYYINLKSWFPNPYYTLKYKFICEIASILSFFCIKMKITANIVTFKFIFGGACFCNFCLDITKYKLLAILIFSKQILDNVDGFIARKNKSSSNLVNS